MKNLILTVILIAFTIVLLAACAPRAAYVKTAPPTPKVEKAIGPKPYPNAVWVSGHWNWNPRTHQYVWVRGHWAKPKRGKVWVPGHWVKRPRGWVYVKGHWKKR